MGMARIGRVRRCCLPGTSTAAACLRSSTDGSSFWSRKNRRRIKGLIINKFRGDKTILDPGVAMLEDLTGIPVVGVAPYLQVSLEDEDSLSERLDGEKQVGLIDIAVIRVPRISNFTDFNVFESIEGVTVRYVKEPGELGHPD